MIDQVSFIEKMETFSSDIWKELKKNQNSIILFGAGNKGAKVLQALKNRGIEPELFCDNNPDLQGKRYHGKDVVSYEELREKYSNYNLLITTSSRYAKEIRRQLVSKGEKNPIHHCTMPFKVDEAFMQKSTIVENIDAFQMVYEYLEDEKSKRIYLMFLSYKITGNIMHLIPEEDGDTFFDEVLIDTERLHHYVDVGAFTGDTIMKFCQFCKGKYLKIDAFELDRGNYNKLEMFIKYARLQKVCTHNMGAWHTDAFLPYYTLEGNFTDGFENANLYFDVREKLDYDFQDEIQQKIVKTRKSTSKVDSIDNVLKGFSPSIIKVNALASDYSVIKGCKQLAKLHKPVFIIDYGTRAEHIINIPETLRKFNSKYRFFLRQKSIFGDSKTILYAI